MDNTTYLEFQKFSDREQAEELTGILSRNGIASVLDELPGYAYVLSSNPAKEFHVKLKAEDFERANALLLAQSARQIESVDKRYYLHTFTDFELEEIVAKPDEWNDFDFLAAQKILKERGRETGPAKLAQLQKERLAFLATPETVPVHWIILGYAIGLLGGPIAIFSGWHLMTHKKTLPNGKRVPSYSNATRKHGVFMLATGIVSLIIWLVIGVIRNTPYRRGYYL